MRRTTKRRALGAVTDKPGEIVSRAIGRLKSALEMPNPSEGTWPLREAAELAHLAMSSAIEIATKRSITKHSVERDAVQQLSKQSRDTGLFEAYKDLRKELHGDCFHQDACPAPADLLVKMGSVQSMIDRINRAAKRRGK